MDFSEFFMEAKHEGTVCSVDISTDGLKVVCGTLYGSLGILDKSNQRYRTLLRSHTDQILGMDFHLLKKNVITVSKDRTIRLWDAETSDQVYEFSSPVDQPLTVAASYKQISMRRISYFLQWIVELAEFISNTSPLDVENSQNS